MEIVRSSNPGADPPGGNETILLIEDEELLREFAALALAERGYKVIGAADGEQAMGLFLEHKNDIQLIVADLGLPGLSGSEAVAKMMQSKPTVKAILASGFIDPEKKGEFRRAGITQFITKPYQENELLVKVREVIDGSR